MILDWKSYLFESSVPLPLSCLPHSSFHHASPPISAGLGEYNVGTHCPLESFNYRVIMKSQAKYPEVMISFQGKDGPV